MTDEDWGVGYAKSLAVLFNGMSPTGADRHGRHLPDASFYLALNAWEKPAHLPAPRAEVGRRVAGGRRHLR